MRNEFKSAKLMASGVEIGTVKFLSGCDPLGPLVFDREGLTDSQVVSCMFFILSNTRYAMGVIEIDDTIGYDDMFFGIDYRGGIISGKFAPVFFDGYVINEPLIIRDFSEWAMS